MIDTLKWNMHYSCITSINPMHRQQWRRPMSRSTVVVRAVVAEKPPDCTADELHYVSLPRSQWQLALWRYLPSLHAPTARNHPLLLLSGIGTNAVGYDLSPQSSFARHMSGQGFDTWVLEVRGAGLSKKGVEFTQSLSNSRQTSPIASELNGWVQGVPDFLGQNQMSIPLSLPVLNENLTPTIQEFQRQLDLFLNSDWDFDQYLKEDLPLVMEYIKEESKPRDDKLLAIGHSMGGILLYAMLSLCGFEGRDPNLAGVATLASSLDYSSSRSSLKLLLPLADPAEALNVRAIPFGALLAALYPLASRPPFLLSWLNAQLSAQDMMLPDLLERLVMKNFCTIPAKLLLQLATLFESAGLRDRTRTFTYKDHLHKTNVPILAVAGDQDLICPPEAVYETVKMIPEHNITYKVFGELEGPHYGHYDLVGGRFAGKEVYPLLIDFLSAHDSLDGTIENGLGLSLSRSSQ